LGKNGLRHTYRSIPQYLPKTNP